MFLDRGRMFYPEKTTSTLRNRHSAVSHLKRRCQRIGRSDFLHVPAIIDVSSTLAEVRSKQSPIVGIPKARYVGILRHLIAGGLPTPDRLRHTTSSTDTGDAAALQSRGGVVIRRLCRVLLGARGFQGKQGALSRRALPRRYLLPRCQ